MRWMGGVFKKKRNRKKKKAGDIIRGSEREDLGQIENRKEERGWTGTQGWVKKAFWGLSTKGIRKKTKEKNGEKKKKLGRPQTGQ